MSFMPVIATAPALIISPDNPERDMELTVVPEIYLLDAPPAPAELSKDQVEFLQAQISLMEIAC